MLLISNNARSKLASGITSGDTSLTVLSGEGSKFPSPSGGDFFWCTLEDPNASVNEIVKVTARSGDTFTIVRGQDGTTAQAWNANDTVSLRYTRGTLDTLRLESQTNAYTYVTSGGSNNAYTATLTPAVTSLASGLQVKFKANFTNTGPATLAVNGLTAKPIRKFGGVPLHDGDIQINQIVWVIYDSTLDYFQMLSGPQYVGSFSTQFFSGDGSTTTFTLNKSVASSESIGVFVSGVYQAPTQAYNVTGGTTLEFTSAPGAGTNNIVVWYVARQAYSASSYSMDTFSGNGSTTVFTMSNAPISAQTIMVFVSGVYQAPESDYTVSGTTLTFTVAPPSGTNNIRVVHFAVLDVAVPSDGAVTPIKTQNVILKNTFTDLHLQTHPDQSDSLSKVMLVQASQIVMDDGTVVPSWDRLVADITVSGAGGLDTGTELASTWYEIYAIRKSSDGTKNLLLHRAKDYMNDVSYQSPTDASLGLRLADNTTDKIAQSWLTVTAGKVEFVEVTLKRNGSPSGYYWITIEADSSGSPSGTPLATSDKYDASRLPTSSLRIRIPFRSPASLSSSTTYWLVLQGDYSKSSTNNISWDGHSTSQYANGKTRSFNGSTWSDATTIVDATFTIYVTRNETSVTMPSGYDQKCLVGYVYNNSSSNFRRMVAYDREVMYTDSSSYSLGTNTTVPVLVNLSESVPPVPVNIEFGYARVAGIGVTGIGRTEATDLTVANNSEDSVYMTNAMTSSLYIGRCRLLTEKYQFVYKVSNESDGNTTVLGYKW